MERNAEGIGNFLSELDFFGGDDVHDSEAGIETVFLAVLCKAEHGLISVFRFVSGVGNAEISFGIPAVEADRNFVKDFGNECGSRTFLRRGINISETVGIQAQADAGLDRFNPFSEFAGEIESHSRFAVPAEDEFLIFGQIALKQVILHFFHAGFMFEPQGVRAVSAVLIFADAENAVAGALICDIDIEVLTDFVRERHCFFHKKHILKKIFIYDSLYSCQSGKLCRFAP